MSERLFFTLWLLVSFSVGGKYPFVFLGHHGILMGAIFWAFVTVAFLFLLFNKKQTSWSLNERQSSGLLAYAIVVTLLLDLLQVWKFAPMKYELSIRHLTFLVIAIYGWIYHFKYKRHWILLSLLISVYHELLSIHSYPLDFNRSDMFEAIRQSVERFLNGQPMYGPNHSGIAQMPYLPFTLLGYLPAVGLQFDPRWMTIFWRAAGALVLYHYGSSRAQRLLPWVWIHPYVAFRHEIYLEPFLFCIVWLSVSRTWWSRVIAVSFAQLTLQFAWVFFPFVWLSERGREFWKSATLGITICLSVLGYFFVNEGSLFTNAIFQHTRWMAENRSRGELALGFGALANHLEIQAYLLYLQIALLLGFGIKGLREIGGNPMRLMAPALAVFICFLGFLENYFWIPVLYLGALHSSIDQ